jgi:copper(I)-binding protein
MNNAISRSNSRSIHRPIRLASRLLATVLLCAAALVQTQAQAQTPVDINVSDAWVRATVPQQKATGAFMQLTSQQDARLVEVRSPIAGSVELHRMEMSNNVMKMRQIDGLDLPAGQGVGLKPGGYHVMLFDLKAPVKAGDKVPLTLVVEGKGKERSTIDVVAVARGLDGAAHKMP